MFKKSPSQLLTFLSSNLTKNCPSSSTLGFNGKTCTVIFPDPEGIEHCNITSDSESPSVIKNDSKI